MRKSISKALFPEVRLQILGATLMHPDQWWFLSDLARACNRSPSSLQREIANLVEAGILESQITGKRARYRANRGCPVFLELKAITTKTVGSGDSLREALEPLEKSIRWAFIYGSIARGEERSDSDIDLMVIGDLTLRRITGLLTPLHDHLRREINPSVFPLAEYNRRYRAKDPFLVHVHETPKIFIIGEGSELERALGAG